MRYRDKLAHQTVTHLNYYNDKVVKFNADVMQNIYSGDKYVINAEIGVPKSNIMQHLFVKDLRQNDKELYEFMREITFVFKNNCATVEEYHQV